MVEPRYTLSREALSLKNRHMIKCYPSFSDREAAVQEYFRKLNYYKKLANQQGKIVDFLTENFEENLPTASTSFEVSPEIRPLTRATFTQRGWNAKSLPELDTESWIKSTLADSDRFEYKQKVKKTGPNFESLHESTLYVNHYF